MFFVFVFLSPNNNASGLLACMCVCCAFFNQYDDGNVHTYMAIFVDSPFFASMQCTAAAAVYISHVCVVFCFYQRDCVYISMSYLYSCYIPGRTFLKNRHGH